MNDPNLQLVRRSEIESLWYVGGGCYGRVLTTVEQVEELRRERCDVIHGPLIAQYLPKSRNTTLGRPSLDSVKEITDFLLVQHLDNYYTNLRQLLPSLGTVRGHQLLPDGQWAFVVRENYHLRKLGLASVCVLNGSVQITDNANLCGSLMTSCILEVGNWSTYIDDPGAGNCTRNLTGNCSQSRVDQHQNCSTLSMYLVSQFI